uniref:Uncharacterized protein n=1 Tax=Anguilla anguilla TaxID=7936 RepID=A0A0E9SSR1_ANGAN
MSWANSVRTVLLVCSTMMLGVVVSTVSLPALPGPA